MITKVQIIIVLIFLFVILLLFIKDKKKKSMLFAFGTIFFLYILMISIFVNNKYYFSYQKFYDEFIDVKIGDAEDFLMDPKVATSSGKKFRYYHQESWFGRAEFMSVSFFLEDANYEKWRSQQEIQIDDMNLKEGEYIDSLNNEAFRSCGEELAEKVAHEDLGSEDYYFLKLHHSPNLVYGIILNDKTCEIIQFYYFS